MDKKDPPEKSTTEMVWDIAQKMSTSHQSTCSTKRKKPFKVLLAVDAFEYTVEAFEYWSEFAEKAFDWYLYHLHRKGAFLILTHFIDASKEKEYQKKEEEMIELQEVYENRLLQLKIDHQWITGTGSSPGEHIIKVAEEQGAEMIVMGARGLGKIKRAILGSVSDYVIRKSKIPVLICKWDK